MTWKRERRRGNPGEKDACRVDPRTRPSPTRPSSAHLLALDHSRHRPLQRRHRAWRPRLLWLAHFCLQLPGNQRSLWLLHVTKHDVRTVLRHPHTVWQGASTRVDWEPPRRRASSTFGGSERMVRLVCGHISRVRRVRPT